MNTEFGFQDGEGYDDQEPTRNVPRNLSVRVRHRSFERNGAGISDVIAAVVRHWVGLVR